MLCPTIWRTNAKAELGSSSTYTKILNYYELGYIGPTLPLSWQQEEERIGRADSRMVAVEKGFQGFHAYAAMMLGFQIAM